jgi:hypothetical protein
MSKQAEVSWLKQLIPRTARTPATVGDHPADDPSVGVTIRRRANAVREDLDVIELVEGRHGIV